MKRFSFFRVAVLLCVLTSLIAVGTAYSQMRGPSDDMIREQFRTILKEADTNKDGKLSYQECLAIWKDKEQGKKNCGHWDANRDGTITEDEYVRQARKVMQ